MNIWWCIPMWMCVCLCVETRTVTVCVSTVTHRHKREGEQNTHSFDTVRIFVNEGRRRVRSADLVLCCMEGCFTTSPSHVSSSCPPLFSKPAGSVSFSPPAPPPLFYVRVCVSFCADLCFRVKRMMRTPSQGCATPAGWCWG